MIKSICALTVAFILLAISSARGDEQPARQRPVAIVAGAQGDVQLEKDEGDWRKCNALDMLRPGARLKTGADGSATVIFFYDDHREMLGTNTEGQVAFRNIAKTSGTLRSEPAKNGGNEFDVPYVAQLKLNQGLFAHAEDAGEQKKEETFLKAYVEVTAYPPIFHWADVGQSPYRMQLFDEKKQFVYEIKVKGNTYKFPYKPPFRLIKSGFYYWQVLTQKNDPVVGQYGFRLLTLVLARFIAQQERYYEAVQARLKGDTVSSTELFLVYNQYRTLDKLVHLLQLWRDSQPDNPSVYRYLTRAYLLKACPFNARQALQQEIHLGGTDPVGP